MRYQNIKNNRDESQSLRLGASLTHASATFLFDLKNEITIL